MHPSSFLRRLLGKGRRQNRNANANANAAILQLPLDALLLIADHLALHDKFLLSHTCKTLWQALSQDWDVALSRLSFKDRMAFWVGLAYTLPNYQVCPNCCRLHPINTSDVPAAIRAIKNRHIPCISGSSRGILIAVYSVQHYHIQSALKLSRLGNIHQNYLAALMKPYKRTGGFLLPPLTDSYAAEPRLINNRFILHEEWKRTNNTSNALPLFPDNFLIHLPVCPHLYLRGEPARSRRDKERAIRLRVLANRLRQLEGSVLPKELSLLEDGITMAYELLGQWIFGSCLRCPTDFAVRVSADKRKATIRAWHDFGAEGSPMDISWKAHVANRVAPWLTTGPYSHHPQGSIRESWREAVSHGAGTSRAKERSAFSKLMRRYM